MTLPSSGTITLAQIATELGVSLPLDLSAANVRTLAGKASGNVVMPTDFYGKSNTDYVPNPVDWGDVYGFDTGSAYGSTSATITGINPSITITVTLTGAPAVGKTFTLNIGGTNVVSAATSGTSFGPYTVTNGQAVTFSFQATGTNKISRTIAGTATIVNSTTGTTLDTFYYEVTADPFGV